MPRLVRPPGIWDGAVFEVRIGEALDPEELRFRLAALGYRADEEIHEPGEVALRGEVVDLWPAGAAAPVRLDVAEGRIAAVRCFDPISQRSNGALDAVRVLPAAEFPPDQDEVAHLLRPENEVPPPEPPAQLIPLTDCLPGAAWVIDPEVEERWHAFAEQVEDALPRPARRAGLRRRLGAAPCPGHRAST